MHITIDRGETATQKEPPGARQGPRRLPDFHLNRRGADAPAAPSAYSSSSSLSQSNPAAPDFSPGTGVE
jgi:hypothetical protein